MTNEGDHKTIWAVDPDGTNQTRLIDLTADVMDIGWLPGHQQFAWHESPHTPGVGQLHIANIDGSGDHVIEQHPPEGETLMPWYDQFWSPDGHYVAEVCALDDSSQHFDPLPLCVLDTQTGQLRDLANEFGLINANDVSSDGQRPWFYPLSWDLTGARLVYLTDPENGPKHVDVLDLATGTHWTVASTPGLASAVVTGGNDSVIYQGHDSSDTLQRVAITGGTSSPIPGGLVPGFRSPDGQWYLSRMFYSEVGADPPGPARIFNLAGDVRTVPVVGGDVIAAAW